MSVTAPVAAPDLVVREVDAAQRRILVRLPNWLGDVVMAAPTVAAIHAARPDAELIAMIKRPFMALAAQLPGVTEVIPAGRDKSPGDLAKSRKTLKALDLDAAVILPRSTRAQVAPWLAGIDQRVGFAGKGRGFLLTHGVSGWKPYRGAHRSAWFGLLARAFGTQAGDAWLLDVPAEGRDAARGLLGDLGRDASRPLVVLEPGASYGPAKCWPASYFGALAKRLMADGCDVATVGTDETKPVEADVDAAAGGGILKTAGRTPDLLALLGVLAEAALVVSNDTGPMHLAATVGAPVLALFGATDPVVSSPLGQRERRLLYEPEPCSPCFLRTCPIEGHPCLTKLGVGRVHREARTMLAEAETGARA